MKALSIVLAGAAVLAALVPPTGLTRLHALRGQLPFHRAGDDSHGPQRPSVKPPGMTSGGPRNLGQSGGRTLGRGGGRNLVAAAIAAFGVTMIVDGVPGIIAGVAAGAGSYVALGRVTPGAKAGTGSAEQTALAAQLLASVLAAGGAPVLGAEVVGTALGGPLGDALVKCGTVAGLGANPAQTWGPLTSTPPWRSIGRAFSIAATRGTSPVPALNRAAEDARDEARWAGEERARSLGAKSAAPLGVCFLPAFVLLAVVPVVATSF